MNPNIAQTPVWDHIRRLTTGPARSPLARFGRRIANVVAECNYAQRRSFEIMTNPDSYLTDRDQAPDTYAEFLFRTSGGLLHEPASAQRAHGRPAA
jgi:hypothetical protein